MKNNEGWRMNDEGWWFQALEGFLWLIDGQMNKWTDICKCRVAFANSNFFYFFLIFWTPLTKKRFFCTFVAKIILLLYTWRATCPFDPPKILFRGLSYKLSSKQPPHDYPYISEPMTGRVHKFSPSLYTKQSSVIIEVWSAF